MTSTIAYRQGDIVLVSFPFTDLTSSKRRPALILSPDSFNSAGRDLVLAAITFHITGDPNGATPMPSARCHRISLSVRTRRFSAFCAQLLPSLGSFLAWWSLGLVLLVPVDAPNARIREAKGVEPAGEPHLTHDSVARDAQPARAVVQSAGVGIERVRPHGAVLAAAEVHSNTAPANCRGPTSVKGTGGRSTGATSDPDPSKPRS